MNQTPAHADAPTRPNGYASSARRRSTTCGFMPEVQSTLDRIDAGKIGLLDEDSWAQRAAEKRAELARRAAEHNG